jgi:hypothetical protein
MVFEKKMSVKDLIEQMRNELQKEQEEEGIVTKQPKSTKKTTKAAKKTKAKKVTKPKKKKKK